MREFLLGEEEWSFLWQIPLRTLLMFVVAIAALRISGKRAVPQGIFEILIIVLLGSAAGDPLVFQKVGVLPSIVVFASVVVVYRVLNMLTTASKAIEHAVEGGHECLIRNGMFEIHEIDHSELEKDEIFADLRLEGVSQLGQVRRAFIEASGKVSVFFFEDEDVRKGLCIWPDELVDYKPTPGQNGDYACAFCGNVVALKANEHAACARCKKQRWTPASDERRVS